MKKLLSLLVALIITYSGYSQSIFGKWNSFNEDTNEIESVIEVYQKDNKAYAKIIEITDPERKDATCIKCKGKRKNQKILGMDILWVDTF